MIVSSCEKKEQQLNLVFSINNLLLILDNLFLTSGSRGAQGGHGPPGPEKYMLRIDKVCNIQQRKQ